MQSVYFKNAYVSLYHNQELRLGIAIWHGSIKGAEFREAVLLCLDLIDRYGLTRWLADDRKMKEIDPADALWAQQVFLPSILASSVVRLARLPSECNENRETIELLKEMKNGYTSKLIIQDFDNEEEAMKWLSEHISSEATV